MTYHLLDEEYFSKPTFDYSEHREKTGVSLFDCKKLDRQNHREQALETLREELAKGYATPETTSQVLSDLLQLLKDGIV